MGSHISFEQLESEFFSFYNMEEEAISVTTLEELLQVTNASLNCRVLLFSFFFIVLFGNVFI